MSLIDANSYNFSSGDYCSTRKTRGQSYTAASIWGNCCNNNKTNNWQTWGLPLIFTIAGSVAQSIPNWCTPKNTDNVENKYQSEIKNTPNNETDKENVTKNAFPSPGKSSGSVTLLNTFILLAPMSLAASSKLGSIFLSNPFSII